MSVKRLIILALVLLLPATAGSGQEERAYRGLWAHAWQAGYLTRDTAQTMVDAARKANLNAIFLQVRKAGDAYFDSSLEPRADNLGKGFDPLRTVIDLAHDTSNGKQRIEVHAWVVVYRVLRVPEGSRSSKIAGILKNLPQDHILSRRPDWIMTDSRGRQTLDGNVFADPGVPGVCEHTVAAIREIAEKYDVDGIHLDYIRYPESDDCGWGYNPISVRRFNKAAGRGAWSKPAPMDREWADWRRKNVTDFVRRLYYEIKAVRPGIKVSAATVAWGEPRPSFRATKAYAQVFQDWPGWLEEGLLDMAIPMVYKRGENRQQNRDFSQWVEHAAAMAGKRMVVIGQGSFLNSRYHSGLQLETIGSSKASGFVLYSYQNPYAGTDPRFDSFSSYIVPRHLRRKAGVPKMDWLDRPTGSSVAGTVRFDDGSALEGLKLRIGRLRTETDGTGFFVFPDIRPDRYTIEAHLNGEWKTVGQVQSEKGQVKKLTVTLKTAA